MAKLVDARGLKPLSMKNAMPVQVRLGAPLEERVSTKELSLRRSEVNEEIKRAMFYGRELQAHKVDLALRVQKKKREFEAMFAKYGPDDIGQEKLREAHEKRMRRAQRRLKHGY